LTTEQQKQFDMIETSPMHVDERVTIMDTSTNSVIQVTFADNKETSLGFRLVDSYQHQRGPFSDVLIVPVIESVRFGSRAAQAGLCSGMRIIAVGTTTVTLAKSMPRKDTDYSPALRTKEMILACLQSNTTLDIRVDTRL
jgi:predicted metalloprotease with PDZ domain